MGSFTIDNSYTVHAMDILLDASEAANDNIWRIVDDTPDNTSPHDWKQLFQKIAMSFSCTPGYALLRILTERMKKLDPDKVAERSDPDDPDQVRITVTLPGKKGMVTFHDIPQGSADALSAEDQTNLKNVLLLLASRQKDYSVCQSECRQLINNALQSSKDYRTSLLSRPAAIELGHVLGLTLEEMQWFMLRVLEDDEQFDYLSSSDLIDIYGFVTGASLPDVRELKQRYKKRCSPAGTAASGEGAGSSTASRKRRDAARDAAFDRSDYIAEKDLARENEFTRRLHDNYVYLVTTWASHPDTRDEALLDWLEEHAYELDVPSRSASMFYRMLAVYCYMHPAWDETADEEGHPAHPDLVIPGLRERAVEEPDDLLSTLRKMNLTEQNPWYREMQKALYPDGTLSKDTCMKLAKAIYTLNMRELRYDADLEKNYITMNVPSYGKAYPAGLRDPDSVSRVAALLLGNEAVEKRDVLSLLYLIYNCSWHSYTIEDSEELCDAIFAFEDGCRDILKKMRLPDLYLPHPMEQAMFLSIVDCLPAQEGEEDEDEADRTPGTEAAPLADRDGIPASSYMRIMLALKQRRNRK